MLYFSKEYIFVKIGQENKFISKYCTTSSQVAFKSKFPFHLTGSNIYLNVSYSLETSEHTTKFRSV